MRKSPSGSPAAWSLRKKAYKFGPCSNPGQPSKVNRKARRLTKRGGGKHCPVDCMEHPHCHQWLTTEIERAG